MLEWEVVKASGEHPVATPTQNSDLYWVLSGGGGGTYAVVVSMTARLFKDGQIASATLAFDVNSTGGVDEFWDAVGVFHEELQSIVDSEGVVGAYLLGNTGLTAYSITAPGHTSDTLSTLLSPMTSALVQSGTGSVTQQSLGLTLHKAGGGSTTCTPRRWRP